jgi:hypothetical protein
MGLRTKRIYQAEGERYIAVTPERLQFAPNRADISDHSYSDYQELLAGD